MSTRQIKDAKDLSTNELIYFKSHAKATYMSDGTTVEDAINNIDGSGSSNELYIEVPQSDLDAATVNANVDLSNPSPGMIIKMRFMGNGKLRFLKGTDGKNWPIMDYYGNFLTAIYVSSTIDEIRWYQFDGTYFKCLNRSTDYIDLSTDTTTTNFNLFKGVHYNFGTRESLTVSVGGGNFYTNLKSEYSFEFSSGATQTAFTYPATWIWANGTAPVIEPNKTYHVSVVNNCAVIVSFS